MISDGRHAEVAFEAVIEGHLLRNLYQRIDRSSFDRERAIFPETVLAFIRETQPKEWASWKRCTGTRRASKSSPTSASGWTPNGVARDAAPRLQVLRADAPRCILQGRARAESGA